MVKNGLLILNSDKTSCDQICSYFTESGYKTQSFADSDEVIAILSSKRHLPDMLLYYIHFPEKKAYDILNDIRNHSDLPVIVISADVRPETQLYAYSYKIDDYLCVTTPLPLIEAHIEALLRRAAEKSPYVDDIGQLSINYEKRRIYLNGRLINLTAKEFDLVEYLAKHRGVVFSRDQLLDHVWGYDYVGSYRCVDTLIKKIRFKFGKDHPFIHTSYGVGYSFDIPLELGENK